MILKTTSICLGPKMTAFTNLLEVVVVLQKFGLVSFVIVFQCHGIYWIDKKLLSFWTVTIRISTVICPS